MTGVAAARPASAYDALLKWAPVPSVQGYKLYVRSGAALFGPAIDLGAREPDPDGMVRVRHAGLVEGVTYNFAVSSYAAGGESVLSNEQSITVLAPPTPSSSPTRTATPLIAATATVASSSATATRTPPATSTSTRTATRKATRTPTRSFTSTPTFTPTPSFTATRTPTWLGDDITQFGAIALRVGAPLGGGNHNPEVIRDGDMPQIGSVAPLRQYDTWDGNNTANGDHVGYLFISNYRLRGVLFQEGMHFWDGGWFDTLEVQVRQQGKWRPATGVKITPTYPGNDGVGFGIFMITFDPVVATGVRIRGVPGGSADFISVAELRVYGDPVTSAMRRVSRLSARIRAMAELREAARSAEPSTTPTATPTATAIPEGALD